LLSEVAKAHRTPMPLCFHPLGRAPQREHDRRAAQQDQQPGQQSTTTKATTQNDNQPIKKASKLITL